MSTSSSSRTALLLATLLAAGCSKEPPPVPVAAPHTPLVEQSAADTKQAATDEYRDSFAPGGIEASYRAIFSEGRIQRLEETRQAASQTGTYEFLGARLMKYRGAALGSNDTLELKFDQQGKVLTARAGDKNANSEEITAIRDRAQALRSHAVAQYSVKGHDQP